MGHVKQPLDHEPEAVEYARKQAGFSKSELARRLGVSLTLISQIESGRSNATPAMLNNLSRELNCPRVILERKRPASPQPVPSPAPGDQAALEKAS
jgi:transcriptional regulator with XRE-family HTH domain